MKEIDGQENQTPKKRRGREISADIEAVSDGMECSTSKRVSAVQTEKFVLWVVLLLILITVVLVLFLAGNIDVYYEGESLVIKSSMTTYSVLLKNVKTVELSSNYDKGSKIMGTDLYRVSEGTYSNSSYGRYKLFVYNSVPRYITINCDGAYIVLNLDTVEKTEKLYNNLIEKLGL